MPHRIRPEVLRSRRLQTDGVKVFKSEGCLEVLLDDYSADLLNAEFAKSNKTMEVQGRNFTLTKICLVPFQ